MDLDDEEDHQWLDKCFRLIRTITSVINEHSSSVDPDSPAGWALADLRSMNQDLLQAMMDDRPASFLAIASAAKSLVIEFLRLL